MRFVLAAQVASGLVFATIGDPQGVLEMIVLTGAAVGSLAVIYAKAVRPAWVFAHKVADGVDILLTMPEWRQSVGDTLREFDGRLARIERSTCESRRFS